MSERPGPRPVVPVLAPGEVYLYAHANAAISVHEADGRSRMVPLAEAEELVRATSARGCRVVAGSDPGVDPSSVLERLEAIGPGIEAHDAAGPPLGWEHGTTALMESAMAGSDRILDDLLARGADVDARDDTGATALHHAAAHGNLHAVEALVTAGADLDAENVHGLTPHGTAMATRRTEVAARLAALGARTAPPERSVRFSALHAGTLYVWSLPIVTALVVLALTFPPSPLLIGALVVLVAVGSRFAPPVAFWRGGHPTRLDGAVLTVRSIGGRRRRLDLTTVTAAAIGGSRQERTTYGARWLVLAHPDGRPTGRRALRRLAIPDDELDGATARFERSVVVTLDGGKRREVILPVGTVLTSRGVDLSASLRAQLAAARRR